MSLSRIRNIKNDNLTWPGFVDALAALLMVVISVSYTHLTLPTNREV